MAGVGAQASARETAELTLKAKAEDKDHHLWPEVRRHLHCRVQDRRRRGAGDLNPKDRGDGDPALSGANARAPSWWAESAAPVSASCSSPRGRAIILEMPADKDQLRTHSPSSRTTGGWDGSSFFLELVRW